ncbi:MAG: hypothetical protein EOP45_06360 [Sphingobacteriaceae bacterium]|nr:MAG: hypothetical protein EOP45_06360 [Sphingobacteriaceae bacterium]
MNSFFDYIYYRVCKTFFKWDGVKGNRAICALTMLQTLIICDLVLIFISLVWGRTTLFPYSKTLALLAIGISIGLMILNSRKYDGRYNEFNTKWKNEPGNTKILKGILLIVVILTPWIGLFLVSKLK